MVSKEGLEIHSDRREILEHDDKSWQHCELEQYYPRADQPTLTYMERFLSNVFEYSEIECGIVADFTGSMTRKSHESGRSEQVHLEFVNATQNIRQEKDPTIQILRNGSDIDTRVRQSAHIPLKLRSGTTSFQESFEDVLFAFAGQAIEDEGINQSYVYEGINSQGTHYVCWPIGENRYMKVTKGFTYSGERTFCKVQILSNLERQANEPEPEGDLLADFHMGYDPQDVHEDRKERRTTSDASHKMQLRIRLRGKDGKLLMSKTDMKKVDQELEQPDQGGYDTEQDFFHTPGRLLDLTLRELRAEGFLLPPIASSMRDLVTKAADLTVWKIRRMILEAISANGRHYFNEECKNERLTSNFSAEMLILGENDPWWLIMSCANGGLLAAAPYFHQAPVSIYHRWLTSNALTTEYIPNPFYNDKRNKIPLPPFMRTMAHIMREREAYLTNWQQMKQTGIRPTSGLMLLDSVINNQPAPDYGTPLSENVFLMNLYYYFTFRKSALKQSLYQEPPITLGDIRFKTYQHFFDYMTIQIRDSIRTYNSLEIQLMFRKALEELNGDISRHQPTFNIHTLDLGSQPALLERFFTSGLLTRIGDDRAIFTSPHVVASIWDAPESGTLLSYARRRIYDQIEAAINIQKEGLGKLIDKKLSQARERKVTLINTVIDNIIAQSHFPTSAALIYYEPPDSILESHILNVLTHF